MSTTAEAYRALLEQLYASRRAGIVFGLERVTGVLARLGNPHQRLGKVIHVGGTNGKGSTVAIIAALARASGARVAVYTSPHLTSLRERIVVDGEPISEAALVEVAARARAAGNDDLTFFEQITVLAFMAFADAGPDITVLEVGLGGRLDATNVVSAEVAVVTGIALDHQDMLGDTLEAIAAEKAGIFKAGQVVVIGVAGEPVAVPWLQAAATAAGARTIEVVDAAAIAELPMVGLPGAHQRGNAAAAVAAVRALLPLDAASTTLALATVRHPGRLEQVATAPTVILDGAHNPHGAAALAVAMTTMARPRALVLAASADKDVAGIAAPLCAQAEVVIATRYHQPRAMASVALVALLAEQGVAASAAAGVVEAIAAARAAVGVDGTVIVAGSLMLVGEARAHVIGGPVDPLAVSDPAARAPRPVVFLDVDGVLNRTGFASPTAGLAAGIEPELAHRLNATLESVHADIVLASSWRLDRTHAALTEALHAAGIHAPLIDVTPNFPELQRWREIADWLARHPTRRPFVIIDDEWTMGELAARHVRTSPLAGFDDAAAAAVRALLGGA